MYLGEMICTGENEIYLGGMKDSPKAFPFICVLKICSNRIRLPFPLIHSVTASFISRNSRNEAWVHIVSIRFVFVIGGPEASSRDEPPQPIQAPKPPQFWAYLADLSDQVHLTPEQVSISATTTTTTITVTTTTITASTTITATTAIIY